MTQIAPMGMPHTTIKVELGRVKVSEVAALTGRPVRSLYRLRDRHGELWSLLEDGVRYRKLREVLR